MKNKTPGNKTVSVLKWIGWILFVQLILINVSAAFHAYRFTHYYDSDKVRNLKSSSGRPLLRTWRMMTGRKLPKSLIQFYPAVSFDTIQFTTQSGNKLEAWYIKKDSAAGSVILFHGLNSNKSNVLAEAYVFRSLGYNTLLVDMRAHGNSGGVVNSLGVKESEEVKLAYDHLRNRGEKNIVLWGMSLGAVIITKAINEYQLQPEKIILEMPFDRLQDHLRARARLAGFPEEPFGLLVSFWSGVEQGYWGWGHVTSRYVKKINCPVLLQWGEKDEYVKKKETDVIFKNILAPQKKLVVYPAAGHGPLLAYDEKKWRGEVTAFLSTGE